MTINGIIKHCEQVVLMYENKSEAYKASPNSYVAGHADGYQQAFIDLLEFIKEKEQSA